jgi:predicted flap endonuclease-1-like 5' DNA nuclease
MSIHACGETIGQRHQSKSQQTKIDMETTTRSETSASADKPSLNPDALNQLLGQMVNDLGAAVNGALVVLGDELGIYTALADIGPATSQQLARKTNLHERQLREWLSAQAASGYLSYDAASDAFFLTGEQFAVFADPIVLPR